MWLSSSAGQLYCLGRTAADNWQLSVGAGHVTGVCDVRPGVVAIGTDDGRTFLVDLAHRRVLGPPLRAGRPVARGPVRWGPRLAVLTPESQLLISTALIADLVQKAEDQ